MSVGIETVGGVVPDVNITDEIKLSEILSGRVIVSNEISEYLVSELFTNSKAASVSVDNTMFVLSCTFPKTATISCSHTRSKALFRPPRPR